MPRLGTAVIHSFIVGCCSLSRKKEKDPEEVGFGSIWDRTELPLQALAYGIESFS